MKPADLYPLGINQPYAMLDEITVRMQLAAAYRLIDYFGWTDLIFNHISARLPGKQEHFLLNPFGLRYDEICASNLVKVDINGDIVGESDYPINQAGYVIHSAIHAARRDVTCVMHTHSDYGATVSALKHGLMFLNQTTMRFYNDIAYHDYEGIAVDTDERRRLAADLGLNNNMLLRNHGILSCGSSIAEAFLRIYYLEKACELQVKALSCNSKLIQPAKPVLKKTAGQFAQGERGISVFAALVRKIDTLDPSYRD